jgi:Bacterial Ig-like domain (group 2)
MTPMAETAVANEYLTITTGWLSNVAEPDDNIGLNPGGLNNLNSVLPGAILQFTPIGSYSDGSTHPQTNTTWEGSNGAWASSNPLVMSVNQQGLALATTAGTATIKYTPANGVDFHEWIMTVQ